MPFTALGLVAVVVALYAPALRFGVMWDDPIWFRQGAGRSLAALFAGVSEYQFYRPLMLAYNRLWWLPDGRLNIVGLHAAQIGYHAAVVLLSWFLARHSGLRGPWAVLCALWIAVFPFSHQAVAWAQAQQPLVTLLLLLSVLALARAVEWRQASVMRWRREWVPATMAYAGALLCYAAALWLNEVAVPYVLLLGVVAWDATRKSDSEGADSSPSEPERSSAFTGAGQARRFGRSAIESATWCQQLWRAGARLTPFSLLLALYLVGRSRASLLSGITGGGWSLDTAAFLEQAVVLPVARLVGASGSIWTREWLVTWLAGGLAGAIAALVVALWRLGERRTLAIGGLWVACGLLPVWAGLPHDYVSLGQRLVYPAVPGIALLWVALLARFWERAAGGWSGTRGLTHPGCPRPEPSARQPHRRPRLAGQTLLVLATAGVLATCAYDVWLQNRLYAAGTSHLAAAAAALRDPARRAVFVNFPDRFALRRPPFPVGYWGITLAPVVVELDDHARLLYARAGDSQSWSRPSVGAADRQAWDYQVDMRGVSVDGKRLVTLSAEATDVYLSLYRPGGRMVLRRVGALGACPFRGGPAARLGEEVLLLASQVECRRRVGGASAGSRVICRAPASDSEVEVRLCWLRRGELAAEQTVFVHLFGPDGQQVSGADGDSWGGLVPLGDWPLGLPIEDVRRLPLAALAPAEYRLTAGIYDRRTNARLPARSADTGRRFVDDEVEVAALRLVAGSDPAWN